MELIKNIERLRILIPDFIDTKINSHKEIFGIMTSNFIIIESLIGDIFVKQKEIDKLAIIFNKNLDRSAELNERITILYYNYLNEIIDTYIKWSEENDEFETAANLNKLRKLI